MNAVRISEAAAPAWINPIEAALYLGVSTSFLNKSRLTGSGPRYSKRGRRILYAVADLDAWARAGLRASTSDLGA